MGAPIFTVGGSPNRNVQGFLLDLISNIHNAKKCTSLARADIYGRADAIFPDERIIRNEIELHGHAVSPGLARRILTQGLQDSYERCCADVLAGRSLANFSAQAANVDSFLQNVKRTWRAPCEGSS